MEIMVTFRHIEPTESLRVYAQEKLSKLKKYLDTPIEAHIVLEVEKFRHIADVTMNADGTRMNATEETGDLYSAIDQVVDKIETSSKDTAPRSGKEGRRMPGVRPAPRKRRRKGPCRFRRSPPSSSRS